METNLIDAEVHTRDGQAGRVLRVAMEPKSRHLTHVIIHQGLLLGRNVVVPTEHIVKTTPGHVYLDLSHEELKSLPDYQETEFQAPADGWDYPVAFPMGGIVWPLGTGWMTTNPYPFLNTAHIKENVPEDDVTLASGTSVECTDGHCGRVERVLVDDQTNDLVGFVIKRGFLFTREVKALASWIDHVERDAVHLKLSKRQLEEMAEYFD